MRIAAWTGSRGPGRIQRCATRPRDCPMYRWYRQVITVAARLIVEVDWVKLVVVIGRTSSFD